VGSVVAVVAGLATTRHRLIALICMVGFIAGMGASDRAVAARTATWDGVGIVRGTAIQDTSAPQRGFLLRPSSLERGGREAGWNGPVIFVVSNELPQVDATVAVRGVTTVRSRWVAGRTVMTTLRSRTMEILDPPRFWFAVGNEVRARISRVVTRSDRVGSALLLGFLTGDTSKVSEKVLDNMKRSGLTHAVAVSGSNVALFLAGIWALSGVARLRPDARHVLGIVGVWVFVLATRWEPSVVRAATMVSLVLLGRLLGVPIDGARALSVAVIISLAVAPELAGNVGFQLSVAATAGILLSGKLFRGRSPQWFWRSLAVSVAAQTAVMPILLLRFGAVPLMSPVVNVVAAPVIAGATIAGAVGASTGSGLLIDLGSRGAEIVAWLADFAAEWPQLSALGVLGVAGTVWALSSKRSGWVTAVTVLVVVATLTRGTGPPAEPTVTFLNVGQGDATLLQSPEGRVVLIDGGPDPRVLKAALRRRGVTRIDLVIGTHADADHMAALVDILAVTTVDRLWVPAAQPAAPLMDELIEVAYRRGVPVEQVQTGTALTVGPFVLEVLGPARRFAAENDGSVATWVRVSGTTLLLPGDIGAVAQGELPTLHPDIILVPHHGSNTTDVRWLASTAAGARAVISVGENDFGHPTPEILEVLEQARAVVYRTDRDGDIVMEFPAAEE
jgi:competence protein ComEC